MAWMAGAADCPRTGAAAGRSEINGTASPKMDVQEIGRKLPQDHFPLGGGKSEMDPVHRDGPRSLADAELSPAQIGAQGSVHDGKDRRDLPMREAGRRD